MTQLQNFSPVADKKKKEKKGRIITKAFQWCFAREMFDVVICINIYIYT